MSTLTITDVRGLYLKPVFQDPVDAPSYRFDFAEALFQEASKRLHLKVDAEIDLGEDKIHDLGTAIKNCLDSLKDDFKKGSIPYYKLDKELYKKLDRFSEESNINFNVDSYLPFMEILKDPDWQGLQQAHPLHGPILSGELAAFSEAAFIPGGLDLPILSKDLPPPLYLCIKEHRFEMASLLLEKGAPLSLENAKRKTVFDLLIEEKEYASFQWLVTEALSLGIEIPFSICLRKALSLAYTDKPSAALFVEFLVRHGAFFDKTSDISNIDMLQEILGKELTERVIAKSSLKIDFMLLNMACNSSLPYLAKALIEKWNLLPEQIGKSGKDESILFYLDHFPVGKEEKIALLMSLLTTDPKPTKSIERLIKELQAELPAHREFLFFLVRNNLVDVLSQLDKLDLSLSDPQENTLLHAAYQSGSFASADFLLKFGPFPDKTNLSGETIGVLKARAYLSKPHFKLLTRGMIDQLITTFGPETVIDSCQRIEKKILSFKNPPVIAKPLELLMEILKGKLPFSGQPVLVGFEGILPKISWDLSKAMPAPVSFEFAVPPVNGEKTLTVDEMQQVLDFCKEMMPILYQHNGCSERAAWIAHVLQELMGVKVEKLTVFPPEGVDYLTPSEFIPNDVKWTCHHVPVVLSETGEKWVLDAALPHPLPLEEWKKWVHAPTQGQNLREFPFENPFMSFQTGNPVPLAETLKWLDRMHFMERIYEKITPEIATSWFGSGLSLSL